MNFLFSIKKINPKEFKIWVSYFGTLNHTIIIIDRTETILLSSSLRSMLGFSATRTTPKHTKKPHKRTKIYRATKIDDQIDHNCNFKWKHTKKRQKRTSSF